MLISELIQCLQENMKKHGDIKVLLTWEGQVRGVVKENITIDGAYEENNVLMIDCEGGGPYAGY